MASDGPGRLLIVDDEAGVRTALKRTMERASYSIVEADSGEAALEILKGEQVDCIVTDLKMPGMGGLAFIKAAQALPQPPPVVVLSGHADKRDVVNLFRTGAVDFLEKPWSRVELKETIAKAIAEARAQRSELGVAGGTGDQVSSVGGSSTSEISPASSNASIAGDSSIAGSHAGAPSGSSPSAGRDSNGADANNFSVILDRLRKGKLTIPAIPTVTLSLREALSRTENDATKIRQIIEQDQSLAGRVVKVANSPFYGRQGVVSDLKSAISRIGFKQVSQIVETVIAQRLFPRREGQTGALIAAIWEHSLHLATATRELAKRLDFLHQPPDLCYLAGLFADAGAPLILDISMDIVGETGLHDEQEALQASLPSVKEWHGLVGEAVATAWRLPVEATLAARGHHEPQPVDAPPILRLLADARRICTLLEITDPTRPEDEGPLPDSLASEAELAAVAKATQTFVSLHTLSP